MSLDLDKKNDDLLPDLLEFLLSLDLDKKNDDLLPDLLDFLLDLGLCAGSPLQLLDSQPEPQVLMAVLFLHEGQQLLENRENS